MKLVTFNTDRAVIAGEKRYRVGAVIEDDQIADLTPSILPMGLTATEILRCFDLERGFVTHANDAIESGELPVFERLDR
jgi:hypothetical protein